MARGRPGPGDPEARGGGEEKINKKSKKKVAILSKNDVFGEGFQVPGKSKKKKRSKYWKLIGYARRLVLETQISAKSRIFGNPDSGFLFFLDFFLRKYVGEISKNK